MQNALQTNHRLRQINSVNEAKFLHLNDPWSVYMSKILNQRLLRPRDDAIRAYLTEIYEICDEVKILARLEQSRDEIFLLFLETSAGKPSLWRCHSAILVSNSKSGHTILLDCGDRA